MGGGELEVSDETVYFVLWIPFVFAAVAVIIDTIFFGRPE